MIPAPAAVLDAMTAAIIARIVAGTYTAEALPPKLAQAAWGALVGVCEVREEWICTGEPGRGFPPYRFVWPMSGQPAEDAKQAAIDFVTWVGAQQAWNVGPVLHHRLAIATQPAAVLPQLEVGAATPTQPGPLLATPTEEQP